MLALLHIFCTAQTYCMLSEPIENLVSYIPVVFVRALNTSASTGMYSGAEIRVASSKKLELSVRIPNNQPLDLLWCRIHQVEFTLLLHHCFYTRIAP
jgi:hypothetical protein